METDTPTRELFDTSVIREVESVPAPITAASAIPDRAFTGENTPPEIKDRILFLFTSGKTRAEIARDLGVSRNTVSMEIRRAEKDGRLANARDRMAMALEDLCEDHLIAQARKPEKMSSVDFGIYMDKRALLTGAATTTVEVRIRNEDQDAILESLKKLAAGVIDIEATPVETPQLPPSE